MPQLEFRSYLVVRLMKIKENKETNLNIGRPSIDLLPKEARFGVIDHIFNRYVDNKRNLY